MKPWVFPMQTMRTGFFLPLLGFAGSGLFGSALGLLYRAAQTQSASTNTPARPDRGMSYQRTQ